VANQVRYGGNAHPTWATDVPRHRRLYRPVKRNITSYLYL
jgi:hypothetical protein